MIYFLITLQYDCMNFNVLDFLWFQIFTLMQSYVHRVCRTARAGQSGYALSLVNQYEAQWFVLIEKLLGNYSFFHLFFLSN